MDADHIHIHMHMHMHLTFASRRNLAASSTSGSSNTRGGSEPRDPDGGKGHNMTPPHRDKPTTAPHAGTNAMEWK